MLILLTLKMLKGKQEVNINCFLLNLFYLRRDFRFAQAGPDGNPVPHPIAYFKDKVINPVRN
jgi:hypothetical protein